MVTRVRAVLGAVFLALLVAAGSSTGAGQAGDVVAKKGKGNPKGTQVGLASYYGARFEGKKTASGEVFDKEELVAAHPSFPLGTRARVTNLRNGRSQEVRIIDRGPTEKHQYRGVIIDVSEQVAKNLGFRKKGKTRVKVEVLEWGERPQDKEAARRKDAVAQTSER
jgi:rare lipoprotein A